MASHVLLRADTPVAVVAMLFVTTVLGHLLDVPAEQLVLQQQMDPASIVVMQLDLLPALLLVLVLSLLTVSTIMAVFPSPTNLLRFLLKSLSLPLMLIALRLLSMLAAPPPKLSETPLQLNSVLLQMLK
jgi:hypothetical protein